MQHLEVSGAVRPIYVSLCVKWLSLQQLINDVPLIRSNERKDAGKSEHVGLPGHGHEAQNYPQHQFASTG